MNIVVIGGLYFFIAVHVSPWDFVRRKEFRRLLSGILGRNVGEPQVSHVDRYGPMFEPATSRVQVLSSVTLARSLMGRISWTAETHVMASRSGNQESVKSGDARCVPAVSVHWIRTWLQTLTLNEWETYFIVRGQTACEILKATCFKCQQVTLTVSLCV